MAIVHIPDSLLKEDILDPRWENSPFLGLKMMAARQKGCVMEKIIRYLLKGDKPTTIDNDMILNNETYEIKGSLVTKNTDSSFSFLQIRPLQTYHYLLLCCFHFNGSVKVYKIPKNEVLKFITNGVFKKQHEGRYGLGSTYLYTGEMTPFSSYLLEEFIHQ